MEFWVEIDIEVPVDLAADRVAELVRAERERATELHCDGTISRIFRVPGTRDNVGLWCAEDATELHELISSLPLYPFMRVRVRALAAHPIERSGRATG